MLDGSYNGPYEFENPVCITIELYKLVDLYIKLLDADECRISYSDDKLEMCENAIANMRSDIGKCIEMLGDIHSSIKAEVYKRLGDIDGRLD